MICRICNEPVKIDSRGTVVHMGGGMYKQYCKKCGWSGDKPGSYGFCPKCGNRDVRDNHCVQPIMEK